MIEYLHLFTTCNRNPPDAWQCTPFREVKILAVSRFEAFEPALSGHLYSLPTYGWDLPNLHTAAAGRAKVEPLVISRPTRRYIFGPVEGETARFATIYANHIDIGVAFQPRVESDITTIVRPTRSSRQ